MNFKMAVHSKSPFFALRNVTDDGCRFEWQLFSHLRKTYFSQAFAWKVRQSWQKYGWVVVIQTNQLWRKFLFCWLPFVPTSPQYYLLFCKSIEAILRQSKHNISKVSKHSSSKTSRNTYLHSWFIETQGFLIWMLCSKARNVQDFT